MEELAIGADRARELGRAVASHAHDDLDAATIEDVVSLTDTVQTALEAGNESEAADRLLQFWSGHVGAKLGLADGQPPQQEHFDRGFRADALGVDLYQALSKTAGARKTDADLQGWSERLLELTNRHVVHLRGHLDG